MGISVLLIIITSLFAKEEKFEGFVQSPRHVNYRVIEPIYAIGQYDEDMMTGFWEFYADSTKKVKIASGSFLRGNGSKISSTGIPFDGRHGEWKHYYTRSNNRYNHNDKYRISNSIQAYQNWNQGKMDGQSSTYYRDGKKASTAYYKDGVKHGIRKEWFSGGFQNTKLFRESNFIKGEQLISNNTERDLFIVSSNDDFIKISGTYTLTVGEVITGAESGAIATIENIRNNEGIYNIRYGVEKNIGWSSTMNPTTEGKSIFVPEMINRFDDKLTNYKWFKEFYRFIKFC